VKVTRRTFVKTAAASMAMPSSLWGEGAGSQLRQELPYSAVKITDGPLRHQYDAIHAHYLSLDNDRLLKVYRQRAGLPSPGADMGGWYDYDGFVPGHSLGQYISGIARIGASTGDGACHQKVHDLVSGFAATFGAENQSILRPPPDPHPNLWVCYTLDKHFAGLIDATTWSGVPEAKELLNRVLEGAKPLLPQKGHDRIGKQDPPYDETYVMPENLFTAHRLTGNPAFRDLAIRYLLDREFFDLLARGEDPFPGQHAYSHAIALSSGGMAYQVLGDAKYLKALQNAFALLTTQQQYASGGWGPNETFITPHRGELYASLSSTVDHFETPCGSYAATKLARYLLRFTADPRLRVQYADYLERVIYNTILAVKFPDSDGDYPYYSTYSPRATKVYYQRKWPCCSGTLVQTVADYPLDIYMQSEQGIDINLYASSELRFKRSGTAVTLIQETRYPAEDRVIIRIDPDLPMEFTLSLRVPGWAPSLARVSMGDKPLASGAPGTYISLHRRWRTGDVLEVTVPQDFRTEAIDDKNPNVVALMKGPVQYVALNPAMELEKDRLKLPANLKPSGVQVFTDNDGGRPMVLVPLHQIQTETYTSYFNRA
jgi:DUF1680 family protein